MAGEVLGGSHDTGAPEAAEESHRQQPGLHRIGAEGARPDHRGVGVGVHVDGRREVHVDAERGQLGSEVTAGLEGVRREPGGAEGEIARRLRRGVLDVADPAPFLVGGDEQRNLPRLPARRLLERGRGRGELSQVRHVAGKDLHAAEAALLDPAPQVGRDGGARVAEHEHLPQDLVVAQGGRQGAHRRRCGERVPEGGRCGSGGALLRGGRERTDPAGARQQQCGGERPAPRAQCSDRTRPWSSAGLHRDQVHRWQA